MQESTANDIDDGVRFALGKLKSVIEPFILIAALSALISFVLDSITIPDYLNVVADPVTAYSRFSSGDGITVFQIMLTLITNAVIGIATYVLLARLVLLGKDHMLVGGQQAFTNRAIWVFWRLLSGIGLLLAAIIPYLFVASLIFNGMNSVFLAIVMAIGLIAIVIVITSATTISIFAAAVEQSVTLMDAIGLLQGKWLKFVGFNLICYVLLFIAGIFLVLILELLGIAINPESYIRSGLYLIISSSLGTVWTYFIGLVGYYLAGLSSEEVTLDTDAE